MLWDTTQTTGAASEACVTEVATRRVVSVTRRRSNRPKWFDSASTFFTIAITRRLRFLCGRTWYHGHSLLLGRNSVSCGSSHALTPFFRLALQTAMVSAPILHPPIPSHLRCGSVCSRPNNFSGKVSDPLRRIHRLLALGRAPICSRQPGLRKRLSCVDWKTSHGCDTRPGSHFRVI